MPDGPEKRNTIADGSDLADAAPLDDAELDVSLERYEYAATSSILAGTGGVGFAATCAFNREKSATKELLELLRPHVRWCEDAGADDGVVRVWGGLGLEEDGDRAPPTLAGGGVAPLRRASRNDFPNAPPVRETTRER